MKCPTCHGDKYIDAEVRCGVCGGDGEMVTQDGQVIRCRNCNGSGAIQTTKICPECKGTGEV